MEPASGAAHSPQDTRSPVPSLTSTTSTASASSTTPARVIIHFRAEQIAKSVSQANDSLQGLAVNQALEQYTTVLSTVPGHPAAFLNRSLCYLMLGFPQLAVADAHRALLSVSATLDHWTDELHGRAHLYNLHTYALRRREEWMNPKTGFVGEGTLGVLDARLASLCVKPHKRGKLEATWSTVRRSEELLLRDALLKAYYRLAVALWKCGGGAWQSAMDQICAAEALPYCNADDRKELRALHHLILYEIECALADETRIHSYCKTKLEYNAAVLEEHRAAGIRGLLQSRFTKVPREVYPWDSHSVTSEASAQNLTASVNPELARLGAKCQMQTQTVPEKVPRLVLVARDTVKAKEIIVTERGTFPIAGPGPDTDICETCGVLLQVPHALKAVAEQHATGLTFYLNGLQMESQAGPAAGQATPEPSRVDGVMPSEDMDVDMNSEREDEDASTFASPTESAVPATHPEPEARAGYQICHECRKTAYCTLDCKLRGSKHHAYVCKTAVQPSFYNALLPNIWSTPSPIYTTLLDRILQKTICDTLHVGSPLSHEWVKALVGDLATPRRLPIDWDESGEGHAAAWDEANSVSVAELFPEWKTLLGLTAGFEEQRERRKDSKQEEVAPHSGGSASNTSSDTVEGDVFARAPPQADLLTSAPLMDWSYDTNVRQPLHLLYTIGQRSSRQAGLQLMLDVTHWDGWVIETLRAKVQAGLDVQEFPKMRMQLNDEGNAISVQNLTRRLENDPYRPPLFGTDNDQWIATLHPLLAKLRKAEGDEKANVRVVEQNRKRYVIALRDIEDGEQLLQ